MRRHLHRSSRAGFSMIELITVVVLAAVMMAIAAPRFRTSEVMQVQLAARQLAQDLDYARTRALATRSIVRVSFNASAKEYLGYLDHDNNGTIAESNEERVALRGLGLRQLAPSLEFERGSVPEVPGVTGGGAISFAGAKVNFDARGLVTPVGTSGAIYIRHKTKTQAVSAVAVTAAGNVRLWTYREGQWK